VFIPPQPERVEARAPRMPRIDELPLPAQNAIRAHRGELPADELPEKRHMTLLQRLASVGLGRRDGEEKTTQAPPLPQPVRPVPQTAPAPRPQPQYHQQLQAQPQLQPQPQPQPQLRQPDPRSADPVSDYARRPAPQGLDLHGRQTPAAYKSIDDDQLDIPAFLRRQAN